MVTLNLIQLCTSKCIICNKIFPEYQVGICSHCEKERKSKEHPVKL